MAKKIKKDELDVISELSTEEVSIETTNSIVEEVAPAEEIIYTEPTKESVIEPVLETPIEKPVIEKKSTTKNVKKLDTKTTSLADFLY